MPVLSHEPAGARGRWTDGPELGRDRPRLGFLEACSNPGCGSGWLHLLRSRSAPVFEGGWTCSAECTRERMLAAVRRELDGRGGPATVYRHRRPLGLVMMEQGWITADQLRQSLAAQRAGAGGRLGDCLVRQHAVSEQLVTRALSLQWNCAVLPLEFHDPQSVAPLLPRLFVDGFGALPLRVSAGKLVYLGFEERLDPVLGLGLERMSGLRVESGLVRGSAFRPAHARMLDAVFPRVELLEAASEPALVRALSRAVERVRAVESRLVRVHDCLWLRMWTERQRGPVPEPESVQDVIASIGT
jgi:Type II secretion system (T2SS), protein E, N-terminal domain